MFHSEQLHADSESQVAILEPTGDQVDLKLRVNVQGTADTLGWVVPIPGNFVEMADLQGSEFDDLDRYTRPHVVYPETEDSHGCGCGSNTLMGKSDGGSFMDTGANVLATGFTGTYGYTVLQATSTSELVAWIEDHGWEVGDAGTTLQSYVDDGGYVFVAIDLAADDPTELADGRNLPNIRIRYEGHRLEFAARMLQHGMMQQVHTTMYVLGDERATVANWDSTDGADVSTSVTDADEAWSNLLDDAAGDGTGVLVTWAGEYDGKWLTRFDAQVAPSAITSDPSFTVDGGTDSPVHTEFHLGVTDTKGAVWFAAPLGLWVMGRRRRQQRA